MDIHEKLNLHLQRCHNLRSGTAQAHFYHHNATYVDKMASLLGCVVKVYRQVTILYIEDEEIFHLFCVVDENVLLFHVLFTFQSNQLQNFPLALTNCKCTREKEKRGTRKCCWHNVSKLC